MKLAQTQKRSAFTLTEMMFGLGIGVAILAAIITASVALQKSFNAVDNYFGTHLQQIRVIDYLNRDAKRAYVVTTSADLQTVTMTIPNYLSATGTPITPTVSYASTGWQVDYGASTSTVVYSINGNSIQRTQDGVVTIIASSTDQLIDQTTDVELANTEYTSTKVTFRPIFTSANATAERSGTQVFSLAYLRNKRRG